jgi:hypothetical protein
MKRCVPAQLRFTTNTKGNCDEKLVYDSMAMLSNNNKTRKILIFIMAYKSRLTYKQYQ